MSIPKNLKSGDKVAIIAIGKKISRKEIEPAITAYKSWGLNIVISKTIDSGENYLAGTDELKTFELQSYINNPSIKAIIFARGGYGAVRIIDKIDFSPLTKNNKWLVGFSDVTVIHNHLNTNFNLTTVHGIMPVFFKDATTSSIESCRKVLFEGNMDYNFSNPDDELIQKGRCEAVIVGGNLSIIYSLCGSKSQLKTDGKILFIEDLHEPMYHIDRMLQNLKRNGLFDNIVGLIIGSFTNIESGDPKFANDLQSVFQNYFEPLQIPIFSNFPSGHINDNHSLIFGQKVTMEVLNDRILIKSLN
jgi:muramoyltetrapeptide carboxypeptidase